MQATARELARLRVDAVKLHNLYVVRNTPLATQVEQGVVTPPTRRDYVTAVVDTLEVLPPITVIQRLGGEAPGKYFLGPTWCLDKSGLLQAIQEELLRRDTWQGKRFAAADAAAANSAVPIA